MVCVVQVYGAGTATVTWSVPEDSVSTGQIGTKLWKSQDRVTWTLVTMIANLLTVRYDATGLDAGTWYFETSSYNAAGDGDLSNTGASKVI